MAKNALSKEEQTKETEQNLSLVSNREYQASIFTSYFENPVNAAQLYSGLQRIYSAGPSQEIITPEDIRIQTLSGVLYLARVNDLAFTAGRRAIIIGEHQSTVNRNIPLRLAIYYGRTMEKLIPPRAIYKIKKILIPTPSFYVFYSGKDPQPLEQTLYLSDSYLENTEPPMLQLEVKVININLPAGHPLLQKCRPMYEYSWFLWKVRELLRQTNNRDEAIKRAMEASVKQGIMVDFIREHGSEVRNMLYTEFNLNDALEVWKEEGIEEGIELGASYTLIEQTGKKLKKGKTPDVIADELETDISKIQAICEAAKRFAPDYDTKLIFNALEGGR